MRSIFILIFLAPVAFSITCYICGDSNLDEFGECSSQFQYDCSAYESQFPADERIYCRTTRSRAKNNTFTIMKECISEQDHYRTFPEKGYRLDEECDLVDVNGGEVAYCLCRSDLCNRNPVAEQFMAFEEKHPELFGDVSSSPAPPPAPLKIQTLPSSAASFAAPIRNLPAIVPINDLRSLKSEESDVRRAQLPSRAMGIETEIGSILPRPLQGSSRESEVPIMNLPQKTISEGTFVGSGVAMRCVQCGDGSLTTGTQECKRQVQVDCPSSLSMCFTRQISLGNGLFGMEKMCVLPDQLVNEFGQGARKEGCGSSNGGRVQYCACSSPLCNQLPLVQQMQIFNSIAPSTSRNVPELAAPELPVPSPPSISSERLPAPPLIRAVPPPPPTTPPPTTSTTELPRPPPIVPILTAHSGMKCVSCAEADMSDPTADCSAMNEQNCEATARFCVTKQTQMSTSSFAMEKKCLSEGEASRFLPGEKIQEGCATSEGGMVNFCICSGSMCNRPSLLQQAQMTGVRDSLEEQRLLEEEIRKQQTISNSIQTDRISENVGILNNRVENNKLPPVFLDEDDSLEVAKDVRTEEDIIRDRQREWARADASTSENLKIWIPIIIAFLPFFV